MLIYFPVFFFFFFFNDTATTEIYTLSLHDALPIALTTGVGPAAPAPLQGPPRPGRSEEHTSELQSHVNLVCRLLLEKKNITAQLALTLLQYKANNVHAQNLVRD